MEVALRFAAFASDFDSLAEGMPAVLDAVLRTNASSISRLSGKDRQLEIFLAGVSSQGVSIVSTTAITDERATSRQYRRTEQTGDFLLCAPWIEALGPVPEIAAGMLDDELRTLLRQVHDRQIRLMNEEWAADSAGGRRIEITVTADKIVSVVTDM
jgi:hypothetical protein